MDAAGVLGRLAGCAGQTNHQIAEQLAEWMLGVARDRCGQKVVTDPVDEGLRIASTIIQGPFTGMNHGKI